MSQKSNRHQKRPSQGVFVLPDNLPDPLPEDQGKVAVPGPDSTVAQLVSVMIDKSGVPLPTLPAAKSSGEVSTDNSSSKSQASHAGRIE